MLNDIRDLLIKEVRDLYSAETQLIEALPKMIAAARDKDLKEAFSHHLTETHEHVARLRSAASILGISIEGETCQAMKGLIKEGAETIEELGDPTVKDAALIAAGQRVEHYEMAGYGCAAAFADNCGESEVSDLLRETLDEEGAADKTLNKLATGGLFSSGINKAATHA